MLKTQSASDLYKRLEAKREPFLARARDCAKLTWPTLLPEDGDNANTTFPTPFQSVGAEGVGSLSAQLLQSLFPVNGSFFRYRIDETKLEILDRLALNSEAGAKKAAALDRSLADAERRVTKQLEIDGWRVAAAEGTPHLVVAGNVLFHFDEDRWRILRLDQYVTQRDPMGRLRYLVTCESIHRDDVPEGMQKELAYHRDYGTPELRAAIGPEDKEYCKLYTAAILEKGRFHLWQEIDGVKVPKSDRKVKPSKLPYIAARFDIVSGEDYGRGRCEKFLGDLQSLEALSEAIVKAAAAAATIKFLCENGVNVSALVRAPNGGFVTVPNIEGVRALQLDKQADMAVAMQTAETIRQRLQVAFLNKQAVQRQAERVTAEEIRMLAQALEETLGGTYTTLTREIQVPLVEFYTAKVPLPDGEELPKEASPTIVAGLEALGRGHELQRIQAFLAMCQQTFGPETMASVIKVEEVMRDMATALSLDSKRLIKSAEDLQAEAQAAQMAALQESVAPEVMRQAGAAVQAGMSQQ